LSAHAPFVLALVCLLFTARAAWRLGQHPDVGVSWSLVTGIVEKVSPHGPAFGRIQVADRILTVDGLPVQAAQFLLHKQPGDPLHFLVEHDGESRHVTVYLTRPSTAEIISRLEPLFVALIFWGLGVLVLAFNPPGRVGILFFLFCQASWATLTTGAVWAVSNLWVARLFGLLLWWLGPLAIHFHLHFPTPAPPAWARRLTALSYLLAILGSLLDLVLPLEWRLARAGLYTARRFWLAVCILAVVLLLMWAYHRASSPEPRRQIGVVALGGGLALAPFAALSLVPDGLWHQPLLPYEISFLFLLAIPLAYGYAILRYQLMHLDRYVSRGAASALVVSLLAGLYLALNAALARLLPSDLWQSPLVNLALVLILAAAFTPLRHRLQIIVNRLFYGGWYDYRTAVQQISQGLDQAEDSSALAQVLSRAIQTAMQLDCACLLLPDRK